MMTKTAMLLLSSIILSGCQGTSTKVGRADIASRAQTSLVGMSKQQILGCMGVPVRSAAISDTEVWTYAAGGDTNSSSTSILYGSTNNPILGTSTYGKRRYCEVDVIWNDDRVANVNYRGRTGGWASQGEQCAFAVASCL